MAHVLGARALRKQREDALLAALHLESREVRRVLERAVVRPATNGEVIVRRGDRADAMYVIVRGSFEVSVAGGTRPTPIRTLSHGRCFGEMGLLDGSPRSADVICRVDGELLELSASEVRFLLDGAAGARRSLNGEAAERRLQLSRVGC